jgi:hypothetical protein
MNKADLIAQLELARQNHVIGLAALALFSNENSQKLLDKGVAAFGPYTLHFHEIAKQLAEPERRDVMVAEFMKMLIRSLIKDSYDLVSDYCEATGQTEAFKRREWYAFARFIRNALARGSRFEFNTFDKGLTLPVSWKERTITSSLDGQPLDLGFFGYVESWGLFLEIRGFVGRLQ